MEEPITVRFQYYDNNMEEKYSEPYIIKINLSEDKNNTYRLEDIDEARIEILTNCNFRTIEERLYYYMFNKDRNRFFKQDDDISPYISIKNKNIKPKELIMINCTTFARKICEILKKDILTYENQNYNSSNNMEVRRIMRYLSENFNVDLFAEKFITMNGITYLIKIIKYNKGNSKVYALESIDKLLDFVNSKKFLENNDILEILFEIANNDDTKGKLYSIKILIKLIDKNEEKIKYIIDIANKYSTSDKINRKIFEGIINNLSVYNLEMELKSFSSIFIKIITNYCKEKKSERILLQLRSMGINC